MGFAVIPTGSRGDWYAGLFYAVVEAAARNLNTDPTRVLGEDLPCYNFEPIVSHTRSG